MAHELPELPYPKDALEPHISQETLELHYAKHHQGYVNTLNKLIAGTEFDDMPLSEIVRRASGPVFNNAAQAWNHTFYWSCMSPEGGGDPPSRLRDALDSTFGSVASFREAFSEAATELFGSGWVWLVKAKDGSLAILETKDADNPLRTGQTALLTCDVWEHAYYVDYRNKRGSYVEAFWNLVNWRFVEKSLGAQ